MVKSNSIASQSDEMIAERYPASSYRTWNEVNKSLEARVAPFSIDLALIIFNLPMIMHVKPLRGLIHSKNKTLRLQGFVLIIRFFPI